MGGRHCFTYGSWGKPPQGYSGSSKYRCLEERHGLVCGTARRQLFGKWNELGRGVGFRLLSLRNFSMNVERSARVLVAGPWN